MQDKETNYEEKKEYQNNNDKSSLDQINDNSKVKPIVRCIFCNKFENQFRHSDQVKENPKENEENTKTKNTNKKCFEKINKEESINGINLDSNNANEEGGSESENEKEKKDNSNLVSSDNNQPTFMTNVNKSFDTYYKNFSGCKHNICYNCIARLMFTSHLNELPLDENIKLNCKCNKGGIELSINDLLHITNKLKSPMEERLCDKHGLVLVKFCLECKKILCKKCIESHEDLFGENLHHLESEIPQYSDLCPDHPTCFLDTLCTNCHTTICHLCLTEGGKHYRHNAVSFDSLKVTIMKNIENLKYQNYESFEEETEKLNEAYENAYNNEVKMFNDQIDNLIKRLNEIRQQFNEKMKAKANQKNLTVKVIKNIYEFVFKDLANIPSSIDYPVLCLYQVFNTEFISFRIDIQKIENDYIEKIMENISLIDQSENFQNKYQFSLKNYILNKNIEKHTEAINSICCLEDGRLVTGGEDKKVLIWSNNFENIDLALLDNSNPIKLVKVLNDGRLAVGAYKNIKIYNNLNNFKLSCVLKDISSHLTDMINLEDGRIITSSYREIKVFNMTWNNQYKDGKPIKEHNSWVNTLIKLNGKKFASGSEDMQILIFDYNIKVVRRINCKFPISCLCNKFNNNIIYDEETYNNFYVGDYEGRIHLYNFNAQNFVVVSNNDQHNSRINQIRQLYGGNYCTIAQEAKIIIHDIDFNPIQTIINNDKNKAINCVVQQPDGKVVVGNQLGQISIYE